LVASASWLDTIPFLAVAAWAGAILVVRPAQVKASVGRVPLAASSRP